jgi:adenylate cyclase
MDRLRRKKPDNLDAWDNALRALWHGQQYTQEHIVKALRFAEIATRLNPDGALGFSALAWCHLRDALYGRRNSRDQSLAAGLDAANRAMTLDKRDAVAHALVGIANLYLRRHDEAVHRFERAIELNPNYALAHAFLGWTLACAGNSGRAIEVIEEALRLSPRDPMRASWFSIAAFAAFAAARYDEGIEWARRGQEENPDLPGVLRVLAASCGQSGRIEEGRAAVAELRRVAPDITIETTRAQVPWGNSNDMDCYLEGLRKSGLPEV